MRASHLKSGGRYPVLRSVAILWVLGAVLSMLGGIGAGIYALVYGWGLPMGDRLAVFAASLVGGYLSALFFFAGAELVKLFIDIEHNTRAMAGQGAGHTADEETAEGALLRGH